MLLGDLFAYLTPAAPLAEPLETIGQPTLQLGILTLLVLLLPVGFLLVPAGLTPLARTSGPATPGPEASTP